MGEIKDGDVKRIFKLESVKGTTRDDFNVEKVLRDIPRMGVLDLRRILEEACHLIFRKEKRLEDLKTCVEKLYLEVLEYYT